MKPGEKTKCPHCSEDTILREKVEMDGWIATAKTLVCAICGKKITDLEEDLEKQKEEAAESKTSGLASLLGEDENQEKPKLRAEKGDRHFCRDCLHYLVHPFLSRCEKKKKDVSPMDDCADYEKRADKSNDDKKSSEK
ncbi:MAG: hypothetical protein GY750_06205 [Lentisphaerae bacterium]|nr:hypothetical protein [Lentisphaerota bacterium]MCP4101000.1 hypothetical protein [Lentisphaerota bacterium]